MRVGDEFPVRVLRDGAPFTGFPLHAVTAGNKEGDAQKIDAAGRRSTKMNRARPELRSQVETLTVEVSEK